MPAPDAYSCEQLGKCIGTGRYPMIFGVRDGDGVRLTHHDDQCRIDAMLWAFGLDTPALQTMARNVRGANTAGAELAAETPIFLGSSRANCNDKEAKT